ncbi:MAG TPA: response regulator [Chloroflexota bacterium]|nr:response regulator [Chloroflexota bacterium]
MRVREQVAKILVVEDDRSLSDALSYNLRREDYTPLIARDAPTAIDLARRENPDLVLLDLMLPGGSGLDVCRSIRTHSTVPIIILTARGEETDRVLGLESGADDYVVKPFSLRELLARVRANLRRVQLDQADEEETLAHGALSLDAQQRRVTFGDRELALQPREFDLLAYFMRHPSSVLTRRRLLASVWGHEFVGERTVDVHVRRLRAKLEDAGAPPLFRTIHGIGYAFDPGGAAVPGAR